MASADLVNEGESGTSQWRSVSMENGEVMTAYSGGCLWAGDPDMDGDLEALVLAYQLKITELQNVVPGGGGGQPAAGPQGTQVCGRTVRGNAMCVDASAARTNFGCRGGRAACDIRTGFTPDPMKFRLSAGGGRDPIDVSTLGLHDARDNSACGRSFITARPDFRFTFAAGDRFPLMRFYVITRNGADATLLVNTPDARWRCNDDSYGGRMPTIDFANPQPGRYDVWVGSYEGSRSNPATFHLTELDANHP
jgi:hypothetical protein